MSPKPFLLVSLLLLILCLAAPTQAMCYKIYVGAKAGPSFTTASDVHNSTNDVAGTPVGESSDSDVEAAFGAVAGVKWNADSMFPVRTEAEYMIRTLYNYHSDPAYRDLGVPMSSDVDLLIQTLLFNAYLDYNNSSAFTPYIGAGIGAAFLSSKLTLHVPSVGNAIKRNDTVNFAAHVGGGAYWNITENWVLDAGYRFISFGPMEWGDDAVAGIKSDMIYSHEVLFSLRYEF